MVRRSPDAPHPRGRRARASTLAGVLIALSSAAGAFAAEPVRPVTTSEPAAGAEWWVGHQRTEGTRVVPLLGEIRTQTDLLSLARIQRTAGGFVLVDQPCLIEIQSSHGVALDVDPAAVRTLPRATSTWTLSADGAAVATSWESGVAQPKDFDGDGRLGMPIAVSASICSGRLDVNTLTHSEAQGRLDNGLLGHVTVAVHRDILHASNACLALMSRHSQETVTGRFRFEPAPPGATCETLPRGAFPEP